MGRVFMTPLKQESESALLQNQDLTWTNHIPNFGLKQNWEDCISRMHWRRDAITQTLVRQDSDQSIIIAGWMITVSWIIARKSGEVLNRRALYTNFLKLHPPNCSENVLGFVSHSAFAVREDSSIFRAQIPNFYRRPINLNRLRLAHRHSNRLESNKRGSFTIIFLDRSSRNSICKKSFQ